MPGTTVARSDALARGLLEKRWLPDVVMGAALVGGGVLIGWFGRFWSFFYDEWGTILYRRSGGVSAFFAPHNGHLQAAVIAVYRVLFSTVGLRSYHPYEAVIVAAHVVLVALVYVYAKRRLAVTSGQPGAWIAVAVSVPLLLLGYAWQVIFWTINLGFVLPIIAFVAILLWRRPWVTALGLLLALSSSGLGVAVAVGAFVLAVANADRVRHLVAIALPAATYGIWWLAYRPSALPPATLRHIAGASPTGDVGFIRLPEANISRIPEYAVHAAKATANALVGVNPAGGWWALLGLLLLLAGALAVTRRVSVEFVAVLVTALVFWTEVALTRAQYGSPASPGASRYLYPGAFLLVLLLVESYGAMRVRWPAAIGLVVAIALVVHADIDTFRVYRGYTQTAFAHESKLLRRAQCNRHLPIGFQLDELQAPGVTPRPYLAAVRALGSPPGQTCG